jgi:hypothetical protein
MVAFTLMMAPRPAGASDPSSIYTVPSRVDLLPDDATGNRVVIAGSFFLLSAPMTMSYGEPKCGYMFFRCRPGQEQMCRMQWLDIRNAIGKGYCAGFGVLNMLSSATIRTDQSTLENADTWELGMGIGIGSSVDGKCPKARALICGAAPPPDGGPPPDAGGPADTAPPLDAAPVTPDAAPPAVDASVGLDATPPVTVDAAIAEDAPIGTKPPEIKLKSSGCAVAATGADGAFSAIALLLLALGLGRRARRA